MPDFTNINETDLRKMLELAIKDLQNKKLLPSNVDVDTLIDGVMNSIQKEFGQNLSFKATDNKSFANSLYTMLICEHTNQSLSPENKLKFNYAMLLKDTLVLSQPELKQELTGIFNYLSVAIKGPKPEFKKNVENEADQLASQMSESLKASRAENAFMVEQFSITLLSLALLMRLISKDGPSLEELNAMNQYGGVSKNPGANVAVVVVLLGNQIGNANLALPYNAASSFMASLVTFSGKEDPLGGENKILQGLEAFNAIDNPIEILAVLASGLSNNFLNEANQEGLLRSPSNTPTLKPEGN